MIRFRLYLLVIEHSKNIIILYFENEVGPGVLRSNIQQIYNLQKIHTTRTESTHNQSHLVCTLGFLGPDCVTILLSECSVECLQLHLKKFTNSNRRLR